MCVTVLINLCLHMDRGIDFPHGVGAVCAHTCCDSQVGAFARGCLCICNSKCYCVWVSVYMCAPVCVCMLLFVVACAFV